MSPANPYALIAIPNQNRAAAFRQTVADTLPLEVVLVRDGDEVLQETSRRGWPALLIVDLSLPRIDGFAVIRRLRRQITESDTRIIAVAAHESLRAAARELTAPLAITTVLPLDADRAALTDALEAIYGRPTEPSVAPAVATAIVYPGIDDIVDRAAVEARRRCRTPIGIGYLKLGDEEQLMFHIATRDSSPIPAFGDVSDFRFLRQVAETTDPLVIPSVESHPVFAQFLLKGSNPVRGFAAVPIVTSRENVRAALCVLDTKASTLSAADIDALASFARDVGAEIDDMLADPRDARSEGAAKPRAVDEEVKAL